MGKIREWLEEWQKEWQCAWEATPWSDWRGRAMPGVIAGLLILVLLWQFGSFEGVWEQVLTMLGTAVAAVLIAPGVQFLWNLWRAPLRVRDQKVEALENSNQALSAMAQEYKRNDTAKQWDQDIDTFRTYVGDVYAILDEAFHRDAEDRGEAVTDWQAVAPGAEWPEPILGQPFSEWGKGPLSEYGTRLLAFAQRIFPPYDPSAATSKESRSILGRDLSPFVARWRRVRACFDRWGDSKTSSEGLRTHLQTGLEPEHRNLAKMFLYFEVANNGSLPPESRQPVEKSTGLLSLSLQWKSSTPSICGSEVPQRQESAEEHPET